ncbi:FUSC family protein [uncultured Methylobacterium sp.]|uniref:FUSC family protein n=1 Tax=uncultured Methylobacterium sp. TaxID=157278 RepID=UPI00262DD5B8|nr:FUSC family protein [uncultured Methylobacterium sp.]
MTASSWRDWVFALKTSAAAILALGLALWIDLPRPYWAVGTVFITSQPLAGATRSKAIYRVGGTLVGAAMAVVLVPNLADAPELLSLAIALWVGACLYFALLDRTPASYLPMLAGYTTALVGFPSVSEPGAIFDTAVSRAEEITLGILCASLVSSVVLPQSVRPAITARIDGWSREARAWAAESLGRFRDRPDESRVARLRLAADAVALDALATPLRYERSGDERSVAAMAVLRQHMLMVLPIVGGIADRVGILEAAGALPPPVRDLLGRVADWLAAGTTDPAAAERLRGEAQALDAGLGPRPDWNALVLAGLLGRLRDFIDLSHDIRVLRAHLTAGAPLSGPLRFRYTAKSRRIRHADHGMALLSSFGAVVVILLTCAIWISTGWTDGSAAPMMAAVTCCLFAALDDPAPQILGFANSALIGAAVSGLYLFAILPQATTFEMVALALAPCLIVCGYFLTRPRTATLALGAAVNGSTLLALQNGYHGNFESFANASLALVIGMWTAAAVIRLMRSVGAAWSARRLHRTNRRSLAEAASRLGGQDGLRLAALMLDRVGLIAPRLAALPPEDAAWTAGLLGEVRAGINVVELRRARRALPEEARTRVERLLAALAGHFRTAFPHAPPHALPEILALLDDSLDVTARVPRRPEADRTLLALAGLRRGLFPDAPPYRPAEAGGIGGRAA